MCPIINQILFYQVMVVIKPRRIEQREKGKRFKYSEGAVPSKAKLSGVKKTLLVGVLPFSLRLPTGLSADGAGCVREL